MIKFYHILSKNILDKAVADALALEQYAESCKTPVR